MGSWGQWITPRASCNPLIRLVIHSVAGSLRELRPEHPTAVHPLPIEALEQRAQLARRQPHHPVLDPRPDEPGLVEPLVDQGQPAAVPDQQLDAVGALGAEHEHRAAERVEPQLLLHHRGQTVHALPEVDRPARDEHHEAAARQDHVSAFTARRTLASSLPSTSGGTRTTAPPSTTSMIPAGGAEFTTGGASVAPTTGTNDSSSAGSANRPCFAWCRHANSCCGRRSYRRATSEITTPGARLSATIRAFASVDQRRRPSAPVITSSRRTSRTSGSNLRSKADIKRSPQRTVTVADHANLGQVSLPQRLQWTSSYSSSTGRARARPSSCSTRTSSVRCFCRCGLRFKPGSRSPAGMLSRAANSG